MKQIICTSNVPEAIGPYSQAVKLGGLILIYTSGQLGLNPLRGELPAGVEAQTRSSIKNGAAILETEGLTLSDVFKTLVFLKNMEDYGKFNEFYSRFFPDDFPARSCVEVAKLPKAALVEIEFIATGKED